MDREQSENLPAVVERPSASLMRPVASPAELVEHHKQVTDLVSQALESGQDYGVIPGTGSKPTLLKPGAERLCVAFGCSPRYEVVESEVDHDRPVNWTKGRGHYEKSGTSLGLYRYVIRCRLMLRDNNEVAAEGIGTCSTIESKYVDRPRDLENTVIKMAQKRALVAAVLNAFGLSDRFTQDVEDLRGQQQQRKSAQHSETSHGDMAASSKQVAFLRRLLKSHVVTDDERQRMDKVLERGLTTKQASSALDGLQSKIKERKALEAEGVDPETGEVDPGTIDPGEPPEDAPPTNANDLPF